MPSIPSPGVSAAPSALPHSTATLSPALQVQLQQYAAAGHKTPIALHAAWLTHLVAGIFLLSAILLVVLLAVQTTKQEGLSGTVGGRVESSYRPRMGFEQQLVRMTTFVAVTFVISATIVSLTGI